MGRSRNPRREVIKRLRAINATVSALTAEWNQPQSEVCEGGVHRPLDFYEKIENSVEAWQGLTDSMKSLQVFLNNLQMFSESQEWALREIYEKDES